MIEIVIIGTPQPQGSKTRTNWGVRDDNPKTKPWMATVAAAAAEVWDRPLIIEPVHVEATFIFTRPKAHYGTGRNASKLKTSAPHWHMTKPDSDKLARAIGDALKDTMLRDDSQIVHWDIRKVYGEPARCVLRIAEADAVADVPVASAQCACETPVKRHALTGCTGCWTCETCGRYGGCDYLLERRANDLQGAAVQ